MKRAIKFLGQLLKWGRKKIFNVQPSIFNAQVKAKQDELATSSAKSQKI